jgi:two-component system response regulator AtoC
VMEWAERVAMAPATTVLIEGESGTGKELIAGLIHRRTPNRSEQSLIEINCASVPESLLESELLGHEKGAFTDAKSQKRGLFERADGGTLFLDEIGELPPATQAKLLRVLESMTFRRLGGTRDLRVDVRVIAATNRELSAEVQRSGFRLDLYHRLAVFHIRLPPLRERPEDILPLANHFLRYLSARIGRGDARFTPAVEQMLQSYRYPGNVRELKNLVERAVILSSGPEIGPECIVLSSGPQGSPAIGQPFFWTALRPDGTVPPLEEIEHAYIGRVVNHVDGNRAQAARQLGISYPTLAKKLHRP